MGTQRIVLRPDFAMDDFDPSARQLHVERNGKGWELRSDEGASFGTHPSVDDAIDAALEMSRAEFREILVRGSSGRRFVSAVNQNPRWLAAIESFRGTPQWNGGGVAK